MIDGGHRKINPKIKVTMLILLSIVNLTVNKTKGNRYLDQKINILIWTTSDYPPLVDMVKDKLKKCIFKNCIVTKYKFINNGVKKYDIILFDIIELRDKYMQLPKHRSEQQQYVFVSREPPSLYDLPNVFDDIFNLTWTYKLNSDVTLTYLVIKNKVGTVIGPKRNIKWMNINDMKPISKKNKLKLQYKQKAAAWFVSHCNAPSGRQHYVQDLLQTELNKYQLKVDVFGKCGDQEECLKEGELCYDMLKSDYYFYLAFENSICEDYVTEKVLTATKHFTVPIVLGGADYTRFLPPGSYLDARALGPQKLAFIMNDTINNKNKYYDFFKWRRYYSLHEPNESPETDVICKFCTFLNDQKHAHKSSVYDNFSAFWSENS